MDEFGRDRPITDRLGVPHDNEYNGRNREGKF